MSNENDGGSAFPQIETGYDDGAHEYTGNVYSTGGMSLRDYFAAKALQAALDGGLAPTNEPYIEAIARGAYRMADAMLKIRGE